MASLDELVGALADHLREGDVLVTLGFVAISYYLAPVLGFLMVSTYRYRSFKDVDLRSRRSARLVPVVGLLVAAVAAWRPDICLAGLALVYAVSAPLAHAVAVLTRRRQPPVAGAPA